MISLRAPISCEDFLCQFIFASPSYLSSPYSTKGHTGDEGSKKVLAFEFVNTASFQIAVQFLSFGSSFRKLPLLDGEVNERP